MPDQVLQEPRIKSQSQRKLRIMCCNLREMRTTLCVRLIWIGFVPLGDLCFVPLGRSEWRQVPAQGGR